MRFTESSSGACGVQKDTILPRDKFRAGKNLENSTKSLAPVTWQSGDKVGDIELPLML